VGARPTRNNLSFQPESSRSAVEVTKPSKPLCKRVTWVTQRASGRNVSEHRAGPEKREWQEPTLHPEREAAARVTAKRRCLFLVLPGNGDGKRKGKIRATREAPHGDRACGQLTAREDR